MNFFSKKLYEIDPWSDTIELTYHARLLSLSVILLMLVQNKLECSSLEGLIHLGEPITLAYLV